MRSLPYIAGCLTYLFSGFSCLLAQNKLEFSGQVLNVSDSLPIPYVNIYTESYEQFAASSAGGNFSIRISGTDTLNFSAVGFKPRQIIVYPVAGIENRIYLSPITYELPGLTIYGKDGMEGFYDHDRLYNPQTKRTFAQKFPKPSIGVTTGGAAVTGLFTSFANLFNSEYQQLKKLKEIKKSEYPYFRRITLIQARLTPEYIVQNTALHREEVANFLAFWKPSLEFIEEANEYQLLTEVQKQEARYIKEIKSNRQTGDVVSTIELRKLLDNYTGNE